MFFIDGNYVSEQQATISVLDIGLLRGFGVFDYLRTYKGKPFHLWDHLQRFKYSAEVIGLTLPYALEEIAQIVEKVLALSCLPEASIKLILTGGVSSDQFTPENKSSLIVFAYPFKAAPSCCYEEGVEVITIPHSRFLPMSKSTHYAPAIVTLKKERSQGPFEALYVNRSQELLEGTTSNFFGVKGNTLYTCASEEILEGITRAVIFNLTKEKFPLKLQAVHMEEMSELTEAFLTASNKEIIPVVSIDHQKIGTGHIGPVTREIMRSFRDYTQLEHWPHLDISRYRTPVVLNKSSWYYFSRESTRG